MNLQTRAVRVISDLVLIQDTFTTAGRGQFGAQGLALPEG